MFDAKRTLEFVDLILRFQAVKRKTFVRDEKRNENDCEHSYMLAMLAWYLIEAYALPHDPLRVLRYALIHDLVEVYAGDTFPFNPAEQATKSAREVMAYRKLRREFREAKGMLVHIRAYERRADPESRFVHSLDKLLPVFVNVFTEGRAWKKNGVTLIEVIHEKHKKVKDPAVLKLFDDLVEQLKLDEAKFFPLVSEEPH